MEFIAMIFFKRLYLFLFKAYFFSFLIVFFSCKSFKDIDYQKNQPIKVKGTTTVLNKEINCSENDDLIIFINDESSIKASNNLCNYFKQNNISNHEIVVITIFGVIRNNVFDRNDGDYRVLEYDSKTDSYKQKDFQRLFFGEFGFVKDKSKLKESLAYKIFQTSFNLIRKSENNIDGHYKLEIKLKY